MNQDIYNHFITGDINPKLTFTSQTGIHTLIFELDEKRNEALINTMDIKFESPVELVILLKNISKELKEKNIVRIIQQVNKNEWFYLKQHNIFKFINENDRFDFVNIYCDTELFAEAVMKGLGYEG